jgi:hypothetical protein
MTDKNDNRQMPTHLPTIAEIEAERRREGVTIARLCRTAWVGEAGYYKARAGKHVAQRDTRKRLAEALVRIKLDDAVDMRGAAA